MFLDLVFEWLPPVLVVVGIVAWLFAVPVWLGVVDDVPEWARTGVGCLAALPVIAVVVIPLGGDWLDRAAVAFMILGGLTILLPVGVFVVGFVVDIVDDARQLMTRTTGPRWLRALKTGATEFGRAVLWLVVAVAMGIGGLAASIIGAVVAFAVVALVLVGTVGAAFGIFLGVTVLTSETTCNGQSWHSGEYCVTDGSSTWIERPGDEPRPEATGRVAYDDARSSAVLRSSLLIAGSVALPLVTVGGAWFLLRRSARRASGSGAPADSVERAEPADSPDPADPGDAGETADSDASDQPAGVDGVPGPGEPAAPAEGADCAGPAGRDGPDAGTASRCSVT